MRHRERGSVFIFTLAVMIALVLLVTSMAVTNREYARTAGSNGFELRAKIMQDSAFQRALAELQEASLDRTTRNDAWFNFGDKGDTMFTMGKDGFRLQILDASARINLNSASEEQLQHLPLTAEQIDSLLDWREDKTSPRPQGAKDEFYNRLAQPYNTKLKPFDSLDELCLVKGFSPEDLVSTRNQPTPMKATGVNMPPLGDILTTASTSGDRDVSGKQKFDLKTAKLEQLAQIGVPQAMAQTILQRQAGLQTMGDVLKLPQMNKEVARTLIDNTKIGDQPTDSGRLNLNTASEAALSTVNGLTSEMVSGILSRQENGFRSVGELLDVPGFDVPKLADLVDKLAVTSRTFVVRVIGDAGTVHLAAEAMVVIGENGNPTLTQIQPQIAPLALARWGWPTQPTRQVRVGMENETR